MTTPDPAAHPLLATLLAAADGRFPPVDGVVEYLPPWRAGLAGVVSFTGHAYVAADAETCAAVADLRPDAFGGATAPEVLLTVAGARGTVGVLDATLVGRGTGDTGVMGRLRLRTDLDDHPRVRNALGQRDGVQVLFDDDGATGLVTLAAGVGGRRELSIEVEPAHHGTGAGRALIVAALEHAPSGEPVFAAVSPGNARSLRAFLACGFVPLCSEVVVTGV